MATTESDRYQPEALVPHLAPGQLQPLIPDLSAVRDSRSAIAAFPSIGRQIAAFLKAIGEALEVERAGVFLYDADHHELVLQRPALGMDDVTTIARRLHFDIAAGHADSHFAQRAQMPDSANGKSTLPRDLARVLKARGVLSVPLRHERFIGLLVLGDRRGAPFQESDLQWLGLLANSLSAAIESATLYEAQKERSHELEQLNQTLSEERDLLEQAANAQAKLTQSVLHGCSLDEVARTLSGIVENPVAIEDAFFQLICYAPSPRSSRLQNPGIIDFTGTATTALNDFRFREHLRLLRKDGHPIKMPPYPEHGLNYARLIAVLTAGQITLGYLSVFDKNRAFSQLDMLAIEQASPVFALALQHQKIAFELEQQLRGEILDGVLNGSYDSAEAMLRRAAMVGYDLAHPHAIMLIDIDHAGAYLDEIDVDQGGTSGIRSRLVGIANAVVAEMSPGSTVVSKSDGVVVLLKLPIDRSGGRAAPGARETAEGVKQEFNRTFLRLTVSIAISSKCESPEECRRAYQIARRSLDVIRKFHQSDRIVTFDRHYAYQLLIQTEDKAELQSFVDRSIGPLIRYDAKHNASLLQTLESYFQNDCNLQKTARASFLHVNTVKYRLQRIEDLTKADLSDAETRLDLHLGLKVWHLIA